MLVIGLGLIASLGFAFWIGNSWKNRAGVFSAFAAALVLYSFVGSPSLGDLPLHERLEEMRSLSPQEVTGDQWIALLQQKAKEDQTDPTAHKFIGDILMQQGKPEEAVKAYQSALRRDPKFVDVLSPMGDALVAIEGGRVTEQAQQIYLAAFSANTNDVKAAFMPGMKFWLEGDRDAARKWWDKALSMMPEGSQAATEFSGQVELLQQAMANVAQEEEQIPQTKEPETVPSE
ncbi:tetratricopeptide repeat protein [Hirschia maritima]|uniref:tetratricopeptide repeat protein n=1 Tax=Hirschia maritima TaxID=1121961 RepID=UPI00037BA047|nr:tetratricopeptide repeat protein [Hirschia maritima]